MFKKVENELELAMFNGIWTTVWMEKGFELEFSEQTLEKFIVVTAEGHYVGTSEIKPYSLTSSVINEAWPFQKNQKVIDAGGAVAEIDKMALLRPYRGHYLSDLLSSAVYIAEKLQLKYFVSLLEPIFLRALRISYQVPLEKVGEKIFYKGDDVVPVLFDMEQMYRNKQRYEWLVYPQEAVLAANGAGGAGHR
ncbi:hypothetical protein FHS16_001027 [Paenibacillus endophyticus]|uniref:N-acetyltransferase domain-containing protein n=1 Tax=Paenibacillus endophyticus TaxID=1294268 RepID=A0A7W5C4G8_9BACL|nr:hypothetical protein [Paenibacillus endophyticus]MBB3150993.1 hypothetical protein [Paenibacillus endophyticus]